MEFDGQQEAQLVPQREAVTPVPAPPLKRKETMGLIPDKDFFAEVEKMFKQEFKSDHFSLSRLMSSTTAAD